MCIRDRTRTPHARRAADAGPTGCRRVRGVDGPAGAPRRDDLRARGCRRGTAMTMPVHRARVGPNGPGISPVLSRMAVLRAADGPGRSGRGAGPVSYTHLTL